MQFDRCDQRHMLIRPSGLVLPYSQCCGSLRRMPSHGLRSESSLLGRAEVCPLKKLTSILLELMLTTGPRSVFHSVTRPNVWLNGHPIFTFRSRDPFCSSLDPAYAVAASSSRQQKAVTTKYQRETLRSLVRSSSRVSSTQE